MKIGLLSLSAGAALMTAVAAQAGEPITLDNSQLDKVAAGLSVGSFAGSSAGTGGSFFPVGFNASTTGATTGAAVSLCCQPTFSNSSSSSNISFP